MICDDNSKDSRSSSIHRLAQKDWRIRTLNYFDRYRLSSAIKEGCLCGTGGVLVIMYTDSEHEVKSITNGLQKIIEGKLDFVNVSRFLEKSDINGLRNAKRELQI